MTTCNHPMIVITLNLGYAGPIDDIKRNYSTNKAGEDLLQTFRKQKQQLTTSLQLVQAINSTLNTSTEISRSVTFESISDEAINLTAPRQFITKLVNRLQAIKHPAANIDQFSVSWKCKACIADEKSVLYEPGDFDSHQYSQVWTNSKVHKLLGIEEVLFKFKSEIAIALDSRDRSEFDSYILHVEYEFKGKIDYHVLNLMFCNFETVNHEVSDILSKVQHHKVNLHQVKILRIAYPMVRR